MSELPISICIMVKNEEENLPRCLDSLKDFPEIIIMDTGSTDKTKEICKEYQVTLCEEEWVSFSHNRNELFSKAKQPWVFWLDADEVVTSELMDFLKEYFLTVPDHISGLQINRMVFFEGQWVQHGHWFPNWNGRIFRSDDWVMEEREVHETIDLKKGSWAKAHGLLEHYSFKDWADYQQRSNRYAQLWAKQKHRDGKKATFISAFTHSAWSFFQGVVLKKGILDGHLGIKIAFGVCREVYRKYRLLSKPS